MRRMHVACMHDALVYLEVDTDGGDHVSEEEKKSSDQGGLARTHTLQPRTVDSGRQTEEADSEIEGNSRLLLPGYCCARVFPVKLSVDGVVEDGPGIEGAADGLEDESSREHEPAIVGHAQRTDSQSLVLLGLLWRPTKSRVAVVFSDWGQVHFASVPHSGCMQRVLV